MTRKTLGAVIAFLFIVSGATGLAYQIVWFKYLSLFLGNTTQAQSVVLATFMGGLAIGASIWGRRADRARHPLVLYALLELGISAYCLLYPFLLGIVKNLFISFVSANNLPSDGTAVLLLKIVSSFSTLLFPTILMGGTLPVLVKFLSERIEDSGKMVAKLYFLNSFGAVVGSMLGGFFLIRMIGLASTIYVAAIINLMIGVIAFLLGRQRLAGAASPAGAAEHGSTAERFTDRQISIALFVAGISGLAAMMYEVAWVRLLIPVLGSSTYSFTLMLVAFISGITIGSWIIASYAHRIGKTFRFLALCQAGVALSLLATLPLYGRIPYYFWHFAHVLTRTDSTYPIFLSMQFVFGFVIMVVPTIFLGMTLPVASRIASRGIDVLGKSIGNVFSINTLGTVIGALGGGLLLIPAIGVKHTIEVGILLNAFAGLYVLFADTASSPARKLAFGGIIAAVGIVSLTTAPQWNRLIMLSGVFRQINKNSEPPPSYAAFATASENGKVLFYKEGSTATVGVVESRYLNAIQNVLLVNGKADASSRGDLPTQVLLAQLPMIFHPKPDAVFVIGLGSGVTVGSIVTHPVKKVDCAEISPEVVDASRYFDHVNHHPLEDPRVHLYIDDALSFLKLSNTMYDVIVSEPTNPWIAGVASLYTREFFHECTKRMNPGGMMVQWFHLYEMNDETFKLVVQTFRSSFRYITVWQSWTMDVMLLGSDAPLDLNVPALREKMSIPGVRDDLKRIGITDPVELLSLQMVSEDQVMEYLGYGDVNTEDLPLLEYWAPRAFFVNQGVVEFPKFDERLSGGRGSILLKKYKDLFGLSDRDKRSIGVLHATADGGSLPFAYSMLRDYHVSQPADSDAIQYLADVAVRLGRREEGLEYLRQLCQNRPNDAAVIERYAWLKYTSDRSIGSALALQDPSESIDLLTHCSELCADTVDRYHVELADIYFGMNDYPRALANYQRALEIRERYTPSEGIQQDALLLKFAKALSRTSDNEKALVYAVQALSANSENAEAKDLVYTLYMQREEKNSP